MSGSEPLIALVAASPSGTCRRCGRAVFRNTRRNRWQHVNPQGGPSTVGCRSTSFDYREPGPDGLIGYDAMPRHWKAVPA